MASFCARIFRKMPVPSDALATNLNRCLTTSDLTMLMIGLMTGTIIYTLPGQVAVTCAGPSVFIAFIIASVLCLINVICFAEFGTKLPKMGSIYTYCYIVYGEIVGFIVAWCIFFHTMLSMVLVCRNWSGSIDVLFNHAIRNATMAALSPVTGDHDPDLLAAIYGMIAFIVTALGPSTSATVNKLLTISNLIIIFIVVSASFYAADLNNWIREDFFPFGTHGLFCSVLRCYTVFQGFLIIFSFSEEVEDPRRALKVSIPLSLGVVLILYIAMSISITLLVPYNTFDMTAPLSGAFISVGMMPFAYLVSGAVIIATGNAVLACAYVSTRIVYILASDGLLFSCLAKVHTRTKTPLIATIVVAPIAFVLTLMFDIASLLQLVVIDFIVFAIIIAAAVLIVRYCPVDQCPFPLAENQGTSALDTGSTPELTLLVRKHKQHPENIGKLKAFFRTNVFLQLCVRLCSPLSLPNVCIVTFCVIIFFACILFNVADYMLITSSKTFIIIESIIIAIAFLPLLILATFEANRSLEHYQVISNNYNYNIYNNTQQY